MQAVAAPRTLGIAATEPAAGRCWPPRQADGGRHDAAFSRVLYTVIAFALLGASIVLIGVAVWRTSQGFWTEGALDTMLDGIGLVIIGAVAVADAGKFLFEEEVIADREMRRPAEARGSLIKFMSITIVALSLELLVLIAKTSRETMGDVVYPGLLDAARRIGPDRARPVPEAQLERHRSRAAGSGRR